MLSVVALTTPGFDARTINAASADFGNGSGTETPVARRNNGTLRASLEDADGDGDVDLMLFFSRADLVAAGDLAPGTTSLVLHADLRDGRQVRGEDAVKVVPKEGVRSELNTAAGVNARHHQRVARGGRASGMVV